MLCWVQEPTARGTQVAAAAPGRKRDPPDDGELPHEPHLPANHALQQIKHRYTHLYRVIC